MKKKVLLLCASHNDLGMIRALRKLGCYIIATGNVPDLVGQKEVDQYIQADYSDKERILEIARTEKIDLICQCCNDYGVYTAAYVAEKLGLPGYDSYQTTLLLHNKDRFKEFALEQNILSPVSHSFEKEEEALQWLKTAEYPLIVKPTDASAGNGIHRLECLEEADQIVKCAFSKSKVHRIVMEPFIHGSQHGFCTFLCDQKVVAYCSNNEYSIVNPYRVEIDTFPADNEEECKEILIRQIEKMADILKLHDGIFHLQYIMSHGIPQIIEVMRRVPGNMYFVPGSLSSGVDWEYWEARARCGLSCKGISSTENTTPFYAYKTILAEKNGVIQKITISDQYKQYQYDSFFLRKEGDRIENYKSQPVGFLFLKFSSQEQMKRVLIEEYQNGMVEMKETGAYE